LIEDRDEREREREGGRGREEYVKSSIENEMS
jgi:hypothetical protein